MSASEATMFRTKSEALRCAKKYEREDHAAGLTERRWGVEKTGKLPSHPWTPVCTQKDPRHRTSPGPRALGRMFGGR